MSGPSPLHSLSVRAAFHLILSSPPVAFGLAALAALAFGAGPRTANALTYVAASPSGSQFPQWEGGDTELEFADTNGDGHVDLISIGDHGSPYIGSGEHGVMVYFTDGTGGWTIHQEGDFGYGGIAAGDANGDGFMDVGYGMHHDYASTDLGDQLIEVALGDGTGTLWTPWDDGLATNGEDYGMAATDFADFDNDGDLDLASLSFGCCNGVHVYRNNGDGTWTQSFARTGGNASCFLCTGDVNGDGFADIAASYQYGCVFLGDGAGGFVPGDAGLPAPGTSGFAGVALGDVDGDGCGDLAFVQSGGVRVYVWRANRWESASTGLPASGIYGAAQLCDMDSDGLTDVAAMGDGTCSVWLGDGAGHWTAGGGFNGPVASETQAFRVGGDIDHNGRPDVAVVQEQGNWPSYRNYLHVFKEASAPAARFACLHFPRGSEAFYLGSVQFVRWAAARVGTAPASIDIEVSSTGPSGPWSSIAAGLPDSGRYQWTVAGPITSHAWMRVSLDQDGERVSDVSGPFTLLSSDPTAIGTAETPGAMESAVRLCSSPNPISGPGRLFLSGSRDEASSPRPLSIFLHDATGRIVRTIPLLGGTAAWCPTDDAGDPLPAGVYCARVRMRGAPAGIEGKLVVIR